MLSNLMNMLINLSLLLIVIINFESCWTFGSFLESSHENLKNSLLWTIHLDPYHGLLSGPQRVNESMYDQEVHLQLEICSCSKNHDENRDWTVNPQTSFESIGKNLKCSFICDEKEKQFKNKLINQSADSTKRKKDGKYKVVLISFIIDEDDFNEESLYTYEKSLMTSFDCIKTGRCQNIENHSLKSEPSDHHIAKRFAKRLFNRTKKKKPGKNVKNGKKSQPRSEAVKSSTSPSNLRSGKQQKPDGNNKTPSAYSNMAQFNLPSDTDIRDLQLHPKVCFMIVCPEQQTIKNVGILDASKRPVQKKPISKAPSFRSASEDHESHDNQKETQSETSTTAKPTTHKETSTTINTRPTEKHTTKIMETRHTEVTTPIFTTKKAPTSYKPEETTPEYADTDDEGD